MNTSKRNSPEVQEQAIRLVREAQQDHSAAKQYGRLTLYRWDGGTGVKNRNSWCRSIGLKAGKTKAYFRIEIGGWGPTAHNYKLLYFLLDTAVMIVCHY